MGSIGDWDEIINEVASSRFIGREQQLDIFAREIALQRPRWLIFYIAGQGGVGKTTLLNQYRDIAQNYEYVLTDTDEQQHDVPAVLGRFAQQLEAQGFPLKHFNERYKVYRQKMDEIENDPQIPPGWANMLGKTAVRTAYVVGDAVPGVRKGLEYFPKELVESQIGEFSDYLAKKLTNKDEVLLIREPKPVLTALFFKDLNEVAQRQRILLCFENFEKTRLELQEWLLHLREYKPCQNIRIAIAGRDEPGAMWDALRNVTKVINLDVFSEGEAELFLDAYNITSSKRRSEIIEYSKRLPVLMSWLASPDAEVANGFSPIHDIVERFLRWIDDPVLRQIALWAAIPKSFNLDILKVLVKYYNQDADEHIIFDHIQAMPFVQHRTQSWQYHDVVRSTMVQYQLQRSPQTYRSLHILLAEFHEINRSKHNLSDSEQWKSERWRKDTLAFAYHFLCADPEQNWASFISLLVIAIHERRSFALALIELFSLESTIEELPSEKQSIIKLCQNCLLAIRKGKLVDGSEMFFKLADIRGLSSQARGYIYEYCGRYYLQQNNFDEAINAFTEAITLLPQDAQIIVARGDAYESIAKFQDALADYEEALALDNKNEWTWVLRGTIYGQLGRYEEALADYEEALALDNKNEWTWVLRGVTYGQLGRYEEALADFGQALTLDNKNAGVWERRGGIYMQLERYEEALADFGQALTLDNKNAGVWNLRGRIYMQLGRYEEALADFGQALTLDNKNAGVWNLRGGIYMQLGRYEEALADFGQALTLDNKNVEIWNLRGGIYKQLRRYEEALADFDKAVMLSDEYHNSRGLAFSYLGRYSEALKDYEYDLDKDHNNYIYLYNIAVVTVRWKGLEFAKESINKAYVALESLDDLNKSKFYGLGGLEALMGNREKALSYLQQAIVLEKDVIDWALHDIAWTDLRCDSAFQTIVTVIGKEPSLEESK